MPLKIRQANNSEITWINSQYSEVDFMLSDINKEYVAIAELNGQKCGLGRLTKIDDFNIELGGMFVLDAYQGQGVAGAIIKHLLEQTDRQENIWCLPFKNLLGLYNKYGFELYSSKKEKIPEQIESKFRWCNETYNTEVLLLIKSNSQT